MKFQYHKIVKMLRKVGHVYLLHHISISNTSLTDWNLNESCGILTLIVLGGGDFTPPQAVFWKFKYDRH